MTRTSERAGEKGEYSLVLEVLDECAAMKPPDGNQWGTRSRDRPSFHKNTHRYTQMRSGSITPRQNTTSSKVTHANRAGCMRNLLATSALTMCSGV